ncbi:MAG: PQQ-like beta-propeller repeat protein [Thermoguttaceae bacterium]|nr:PQQ-like beta-propeller repeat protein [Thermoguttaceae bacterium]MDW8039129.1 PQQ-binding-like beta-propeller repeat protein [Thermoguttaceae bacterium]
MRASGQVCVWVLPRILMGIALVGVVSLEKRVWAFGEQPPAGSHQAPGLVRAWASQVQMDPARSRVQYLCLYEDTLLVQTDRAVLHAFDAETGRTQWTMMVGSPDRPSLQPDLNEQLVAVVNGSTLFVLNRIDGKILWKTALEGFPGAGPTLGRGRVYVPMLQGLVYVYPLQPAKDPREELGELRSPRPKRQKETPQEQRARMAEFRLSQEKIRPVVCQSIGHTMIPLRVGGQDAVSEYVAWPSHLGDLFIGVFDSRAEKMTVRHRLQTYKSISAPPAYSPPPRQKPAQGGTFFVANHEGYVWAVEEKSGMILWKFATGRTIQSAPVLIDTQLFVTPLDGGLYCLNAQTGQQQWYQPSIVQFVAASKQCVYATDKQGRLHILDRKAGTHMDSFSVAGQMLLTNTENDRIYMASPTGLVQCFRESELTEPVVHSTARAPTPQTPPPIIQQEAFPAQKEQSPPQQPQDKLFPFEQPPSKEEPVPKEKPQEAPNPF